MSNKLSTKNIKTGGGGGEVKTLEPGNEQCTLSSIELRPVTFKEGGLEVILNLEGPKIPGFQGFMIDKDDPSKGHFECKIGRVKASEWAYADGETKSGIEISRDLEILRFIKQLCTAMQILPWLESQDDKHDTIESLIAAFNKDKPFAGKVLHYCIGGKEYTNKNGYTQFDLFLPKFTKQGVPFSDKENGVLEFNPTEHIRKKKVTTVTEFGEDDNTLSGPAATDFSLDD